MKKYLFGIFALVLAIGFSAFTSAPEATKATGTVYSYWYEIDPSTSEVINETPVFFNKDEETVIGLQSCKDDTAEPICLAGSDTELELEQIVSGFAADALVRETEQ